MIILLNNYLFLDKRITSNSTEENCTIFWKFDLNAQYIYYRTEENCTIFWKFHLNAQYIYYRTEDNCTIFWKFDLNAQYS